MRRRLPVLLAVAALGWGTAAPADDPEVPEKHIKVSKS